MKVSYSDVATPTILIDDFLEKDDAAKVLHECIELKRLYHDASVLAGTTEKPSSVVDAKIRKNLVVYIDHIYLNNRGNSDILKLLVDKGIMGNYDLWAKDHTGFEIINQNNRIETVLSRYGESDFYDFHRDYNFQRGNRLITAVYYVNKTPKMFEGGTLEIKGEKQNFSMEPQHNRLIVFNSGAYHRVNPVKMLSDNFDDGRFSINIWIGYKTA